VLALTFALLLAEPARVQAARKASAAAIQELFAHQPYPPRRMVLRAFKSERALELWAGAAAGPLALIKTYRICASSGGLGPKERAGDGQVPEGFYRISGFNPQSQFLLSMRVSYPNALDRRLKHGGGDIFIHGSCVTIGCIPIEDGPIQELYVIASDARAAGAEIDVHLFPGRDWPGLLASARPPLRAFWENLQEGFQLFERIHQPLRVSVDASGRYRFAH
jgi:murein L,D-transpeptidase YafK